MRLLDDRSDSRRVRPNSLQAISILFTVLQGGAVETIALSPHLLSDWPGRPVISFSLLPGVKSASSADHIRSEDYLTKNRARSGARVRPIRSG